MITPLLPFKSFSAREDDLSDFSSRASSSSSDSSTLKSAWGILSAVGYNIQMLQLMGEKIEYLSLELLGKQLNETVKQEAISKRFTMRQLFPISGGDSHQKAMSVIENFMREAHKNLCILGSPSMDLKGKIVIISSSQHEGAWQTLTTSSRFRVYGGFTKPAWKHLLLGPCSERRSIEAIDLATKMP